MFVTNKDQGQLELSIRYLARATGIKRNSPKNLVGKFVKKRTLKTNLHPVYTDVIV